METCICQFYIPPRVQLHCKVQEKLHRVTGALVKFSIFELKSLFISRCHCFLCLSAAVEKITIPLTVLYLPFAKPTPCCLEIFQSYFLMLSITSRAFLRDIWLFFLTLKYLASSQWQGHYNRMYQLLWRRTTLTIFLINFSLCEETGVHGENLRLSKER